MSDAMNLLCFIVSDNIQGFPLNISHRSVLRYQRRRASQHLSYYLLWSERWSNHIGMETLVYEVSIHSKTDPGYAGLKYSFLAELVSSTSSP
jgi:hypothetical protein